MTERSEHVELDRLATVIDDHAFDADRWGCGCGYKPEDSDLNVLRDHRRHVAQVVLSHLRIQEADDGVAEVLDLVTGWCGPHAVGDLTLIEAAANRALDALRGVDHSGSQGGSDA